MPKKICLSQPLTGSAACYADSGGPALQKYNGRWVIQGVSSYGIPGCGVNPKRFPDVLCTRLYIFCLGLIASSINSFFIFFSFIIVNQSIDGTNKYSLIRIVSEFASLYQYMPK